MVEGDGQAMHFINFLQIDIWAILSKMLRVQFANKIKHDIEISTKFQGILTRKMPHLISFRRSRWQA